MNNFADALQRATDRVYQSAGEAATYTDRLAASSACTVLISRNLTDYGDVAQFAANTVILSVRQSEIAQAPRRGETFTVGATTYTVDSPQASDGVEHKVFAA